MKFQKIGSLINQSFCSFIVHFIVKNNLKGKEVLNMNCAVAGRISDIAPAKSFTSKDGKTVNYVPVTIIDEDAFMDSDRNFLLRLSSEKAKGLEVGQSYRFSGSLSTNKGLLTFKVGDVSVIK